LGMPLEGTLPYQVSPLSAPAAAWHAPTEVSGIEPAGHELVSRLPLTYKVHVDAPGAEPAPGGGCERLVR
jgi:hypothetical protein